MVPISALVHKDPDVEDDVLDHEADIALGKSPALQILAELLKELRELDLPWWTPEQRREALTATDRMRMLEQRPDIRQRIVTELTGLLPKAARRMAPDMQASLLDEVLEEDRTSAEFEVAFKAEELVLYGDAANLFFSAMDALPLDQDTEEHRLVMEKFLNSCLRSDRDFDNKKLQPIITHWDLRTALDYELWQAKIPLEVRAAVDKARLELEKAKPGERFSAKHEVEIVTVSKIVTHIPLVNFKNLIEVAAKKMGFERPLELEEVVEEITVEEAPESTEVSDVIDGAEDEGPKA